VRLPFDAEGIVAVGAEQKNTLCFGSGNEAILSQHIGDLDDLATLEFAEEVLERYPRLFRVVPAMFVRDRHPDYLSTEIAENSGLPVLAVAHHHAHIASCMAEHGLTGDVIGVALDGTGYGADGAIWGGEFLIAGYATYKRFAHLDYIPLPGGDAAADSPWRSGLSYLVRAYGAGGPPPEVRNRLALFDAGPASEISAVYHALERRINAPATSSAGRLFDAVASICGICVQSAFDAEAPIRLMDQVREGVEEAYSFGISPPGTAEGPDASGEAHRIRFDATIREIVDDLLRGVDVGLISARFHNTFCESIVRAAREARGDCGLNRVVLSGGVFQNRYVLERSERLLAADGFEVYSHEAVPSNDGGIALGQLAIAAARRQENS
jgi:hydrogenase maturation protein HypF